VIFTTAQLWNVTPFQLRRVWGGINGVLFHQMLHGVDIRPPSSRFSKSIGHQHVLEPDLRTIKGAHDFAQHLLTKAAERLRRGDYYCRRLGLHLSWLADLGGYWDEIAFLETHDTGFLLARLEQLWERLPRYKPLSVGVVLLDLVPASRHQPDLFTADNQRRQKLSPLIDRINDRYGRCAIGFGLFPADQDPPKIRLDDRNHLPGVLRLKTRMSQFGCPKKLRVFNRIQELGAPTRIPPIARRNMAF
jgi:DNA polymerase IV